MFFFAFGKCSVYYGIAGTGESELSRRGELLTGGPTIV